MSLNGNYLSDLRLRFQMARRGSLSGMALMFNNYVGLTVSDACLPGRTTR